MGIELSHEEGDELEDGQTAYESLCAVAVDADEFTLMGLLAAIQRGDDWSKLTRPQRELCEALEGELFDDDEGDGV